MVNMFFNKVLGENEKCVFYFYFKTEGTFWPTQYIFASFVIDKGTIGVWIYLWAFYPVLLIYISVFVTVPCCLDYCRFVV